MWAKLKFYKMCKIKLDAKKKKTAKGQGRIIDRLIDRNTDYIERVVRLCIGTYQKLRDTR